VHIADKNAERIRLRTQLDENRQTLLRSLDTDPDAAEVRELLWRDRFRLMRELKELT
jgi:hypothetical protein